MHKSQSLFNLTTALHVSGVTITHLQENKTTVTTASGNRYTVLLSAAIVEELERTFKRHEQKIGCSDFVPWFIRFHPRKGQIVLSTYLLTPWSRVLLEKLTSKLCS
jgi:hypothetical protein